MPNYEETTQSANEMLMVAAVIITLRKLTSVNKHFKQPLNKSLQKVYATIQNNPKITHSETMETLHISESTAKRAPRTSKRLGYITREGGDKTVDGLF